MSRSVARILFVAVPLALCAHGPQMREQVFAAPGVGARWRVTVTRQGLWERTVIDGRGVSTTATASWGTNPPVVAATLGPGCMVGYIGTGTVTVTADWVDTMGHPAPNPPALVSLLFTSNSRWDCPSSLTLSEHEAQDGWPEDREVLTDTKGIRAGQSYGRHLITYDASTGHVRRTITVRCGAKAHSQSSSGVLHATIDVSACVDSRTAWITSSVDPTYHRELNAEGKPVRVANRQDPAGAASYGDQRESLAPFLLNPTVTYIAHMAGGRTADSSYHWYDSTTQRSGGASSRSSPLPAPLVSGYGSLARAGGTQTHVHLRVIDAAAPGVQCTANYWLRYHFPFENWLRTSALMRPRRIDRYITDWQTRAMECDNPADAPRTFILDHDVEVSGRMSGSIRHSLGREADSRSLSRYESINIGETRTATLRRGLKITVPPHQRIEVWAAMITEDRTGTASVWDGHGYVRDTTWQGTWASGRLAVGARCVPAQRH